MCLPGRCKCLCLGQGCLFHSTAWSRQLVTGAALSSAFWVQITTRKVTQGSTDRFQAGWDGAVCKAGEQLKWEEGELKRKRGKKEVIIILAFLVIQLTACITCSGRPFLTSPPNASHYSLSGHHPVISVQHLSLSDAFVITCPYPRLTIRSVKALTLSVLFTVLCTDLTTTPGQ